MSANEDQNVKIVSIDDKMYFVTEEPSAGAQRSEANHTQIVITPSEANIVESSQDIEHETLWTQNDYTLRDLLVLLVQRHCIEDIMDSKMKSKLWDLLHRDFTMYTKNMILITKQQLSRKWHNWKTYNKARKKPHPFAIVGRLDENSIREKCNQLLERSKSQNVIGVNRRISIQKGLTENNPIHNSNIVIERSGSNAFNTKKLEHEINLQTLNYEKTKWSLEVEKQSLRRNIIHKKLHLKDIKLEEARIELSLLKQKLKENSN